MNCFRFFTVFFLLFPLFTVAQPDKSNYALLWEITGNGLEHPSYLFGTMHVQDRRAFEFPDSLRIVFESAEAYAMEVNPNAAVSYFMELSFSGDTSNVLRQLLSEEEYRRVDALVQKQLGQPIDSMDIKDPMLLEMLLSDFEEPEETDKNLHFLDLHLFDIAFRQNKELIGLERIEDYDNLNRSFFREVAGQDNDTTAYSSEEEHAFFEELLELYRSGDLEALTGYLDIEAAETSDYQRELLSRRNYKMAAALENEIRRQSVFCAVGVAHLPGEDGLIQLLREKGYRLRQVTPAFEDPAEWTASPKQERRWRTLESPHLGYTLALPEAPVKLQVPSLGNQIQFEMYLYSDMIRESFYLYFAGAGLPESSREQLLKDFTASMLEDLDESEVANAVSSRSIRRNGLRGEEMTALTSEGERVRWQAFQEADRLYFFFSFLTDSKTNKSHEKRFFNSIRFTLPQPVRGLETVRDAAGAFRLDFPVSREYSYERQAFESDDAHRFYGVKGMQGRDPETNASYYLYYYDQPAGITVENDHLLLENQIRRLEQSWGEARELHSGRHQGCTYYEARFPQEQTMVAARLLQRGNRQYRLIAEYPHQSGSQVDAAAFFDAFEPLPFQWTPLLQRANPATGFHIRVPGAWFMETTDYGREDYPLIRDHTLYTRDTLSGSNYMAIEYEYSPYFEDDNPEFFLDALIPDEAVEGASLSDTLFQGRRALYLEEKDPAANIYSHRLYLQEGNYLYELVGQFPESFRPVAAFEYFRTFHLQRSLPGDFLSIEKSEQVFRDLVAGDPAKVQGAKREMDHHEFGPEHLPAIYDLLRRDLPGDTSDETTVHELLFRELLFTNDASTLPFLEELYRDPGQSTEKRAFVLEVLARLHTEAAYKQFFRLAPSFEGEPESSETAYSHLLEGMVDTLSLTARYIRQLAGLSRNEALAYPAYSVLYQLLRQDSLGTSAADGFAGQFLGEAQRIVRDYQLLENPERQPDFPAYWTLDALHIILGELSPNPAIQTYLQNMQQLQEPRLLITIIDNALMQERPVTRSAYERVFADPPFWYNLLENVNYEGHLEQLPADLFTQEATLKAYLADFLLEEYEVTLERFEILEQEPYQYDETAVSLYWFRFTVTGQEEELLGVVSQPAGTEEVAVYPEIFELKVLEEVDWKTVKRGILEELEDR